MPLEREPRLARIMELMEAKVGSLTHPHPFTPIHTHLHSSTPSHPLPTYSQTCCIQKQERDGCPAIPKSERVIRSVREAVQALSGLKKAAEEPKVQSGSGAKEGPEKGFPDEVDGAVPPDTAASASAAADSSSHVDLTAAVTAPPTITPSTATSLISVEVAPRMSALLVRQLCRDVIGSAQRLMIPAATAPSQQPSQSPSKPGVDAMLLSSSSFTGASAGSDGVPMMALSWDEVSF